jgi:hypothetical protein
MSVYFAIPSCRPLSEAEPIFAKWRERGYRIALIRQGEPTEAKADINVLTVHYHGWARSINMIAGHILRGDPTAEWIVSGGDDTLPDPNHTAEEIAAECTNHFAGTFGVMQPTGDKALWPGSAIDKFAGSPWMGREWCERINGGNGPMREEFHHMYGDEALQCIAEKYGAFWQRPDLIHKHLHYLRPDSYTGIPEFMRMPNSPDHFQKYGAIFHDLKAAGWPGSEPLAAMARHAEL